MMKKYWMLLSAITVMFVFSTTILSAQDEDEELSGSERIVYGLNLSWTNRTVSFLEAVPVVGYRVTPSLTSGIGIKYEYFSTAGAFMGSVNSSSTSVYGGTFFVSYELLKNTISKGLSVFAHAEVQELNLSTKFFSDSTGTGRFYYTSYVVGPGIRQQIGRRASVNISLLFSIHRPSISPFPENPYLRFTILF